MKPVEEVTIVIPSEGHVVRKHLVNKGKLVLWFHLVDLRYKSQKVAIISPQTPTLRKDKKKFMGKKALEQPMSIPESTFLNFFWFQIQKKEKKNF